MFTVEGEALVIDESGEESEEDGGGWNYYKKPTEEVEKKLSGRGIIFFNPGISTNHSP